MTYNDIDDDCKFWNDWKVYCIIKRIHPRMFKDWAFTGEFWEKHKQDFIDYLLWKEALSKEM